MYAEIAKIIVAAIAAVAQHLNADVDELLAAIGREAVRQDFATDAAWKEHQDHLKGGG